MVDLYNQYSGYFCEILELNCDPLSDGISVGKYAGLVMTTTMYRPVFFAVAF